MKRRTLLQTAAAAVPSIPMLRGAATDPLSWEAVMAEEWQIPAKLQRSANIRPRLFINKERVSELRRKIRGSHRDVWAIAKENADTYRGKPTPSNYKSQGDMRSAGRGVPWQALAYLVTGEAAYLEGARKWMLDICRFPHWEQDNSLSGGECLFGVAVGYDWLYDKLTGEEKQLIRSKLVAQARVMKAKPVHRDRWLANHNHVEHLGLAAAGLALFDEVPEAAEWIRQSHLVFRAMLRMSGQDGGSTEGHQYWAYTTEAFLRYAELARDLLGVSLYDHEWVRAIPNFILHSTLPGFTEQDCVMSYGDSHREYSSHGPTHILFRLAAEYRNKHAQWLALEMQRRGVGRDAYCTWANLLWYDETLQPVPPSDLPPYHDSKDIGWFTARSGWDDDAVMVGFKCGPMHGHKAQEYYDKNPGVAHEIGGGHGHPDVNSFQIFARRKWLAIDPGYERAKWTRTHNTVLVNGKGQTGEGQTWFDRDAVLRTRATSGLLLPQHTPQFDYFVGDAKNIYPAETTLELFHRHFLYLRPDVIIVADELRSSSPATFEWLLHTDESIESIGERRFAVRNGNSALDVQFLATAAVQSRISGKTLSAETGPATQSLIVSVLQPRAATQSVLPVRMTSANNRRLKLDIEGTKGLRSVTLNLETRNVSVTTL